MPLKVLEIGPGPKPQAQLIWKDAEITTFDVDANYKPDILGDARNLVRDLEGRKFDVIFASHMLEHVPWWDCDRVLAEWVECLNDGGSLHIIVPSLEWAAKQILSEKPSRAVIPHLYAGVTTGWDVHVNGFTMRRLRCVMEKAGLAVAQARTGEYHIRAGVEILEAEQHYCAGYKLGEIRPPPKKE